MARFKMYIEFEGTRYSGWQAQKNARTVQGAFLTACDTIFKGQQVELKGAGRTDSGVHAICMVAHMEVKTMLAPEIIKMKFNDVLPYDINVMEVQKASPNFHARHDAVSRSYVYQISRKRSAFAKNYVWWIKDKLNAEEMKKAAKLFVGMHDFASFSDDDKEEKSTKVLIKNIEVVEVNDLILIRITGSHFLWKMVRRIIGVLAEVGRGKKSMQDIVFYLNNNSSEPAKFTAPPSGLFLETVLYNGEENKRELAPLLNL